MTTERRNVTGDVAKLVTNDFTVNTAYQQPVVNGYDELKSKVQRLNDRYSNLVVQSSEEAHELSKRGGTLTKLRKIHKQIQEQQRMVHRQAKQSYAVFDSQMSELLDLVDSACDNIKTQTDRFHQEEKIKALNKMEAIFDDQIKGQFAEKAPKWCDFSFLVKFEPKLYNKSENVQKKKIIQFLYEVCQDRQKMIEQYRNGYHSKVFVQATLNCYKETRDINQAILTGIEAHQRAEKIAQAMQQEQAQAQREQEAQKDTPVSNEPVSQNDNGVVSSNEGGVYYDFIIRDLADARAVKELLDQRNACYKQKIVPYRTKR